MTDRQSLAEIQTEWAEERTVLSVERTFAGWLRTGMGAVGVAIGLHAVFVSGAGDWPARVVASMFLVIAVALFAQANRQARRMLEDLSSQRPIRAPVPSAAHFTAIAAAFIVAAIAVGVLLWSL